MHEVVSYPQSSDLHIHFVDVDATRTAHYHENSIYGHSGSILIAALVDCFVKQYVSRISSVGAGYRNRSDRPWVYQ